MKPMELTAANTLHIPSDTRLSRRGDGPGGTNWKGRAARTRGCRLCDRSGHDGVVRSTGIFSGCAVCRTQGRGSSLSMSFPMSVSETPAMPALYCRGRDSLHPCFRWPVAPAPDRSGRAMTSSLSRLGTAGLLVLLLIYSCDGHQKVQKLRKEVRELKGASVTLTPGSKGYQVIRHPLGSATLKLTEVQAHAKGSAIALEIGNATSADLTGASVDVA